MPVQRGPAAQGPAADQARRALPAAPGLRHRRRTGRGGRRGRRRHARRAHRGLRRPGRLRRGRPPLGAAQPGRPQGPRPASTARSRLIAERAELRAPPVPHRAALRPRAERAARPSRTRTGYSAAGAGARRLRPAARRRAGRGGASGGGAEARAAARSALRRPERGPAAAEEAACQGPPSDPIVLASGNLGLVTFPDIAGPGHAGGDRPPLPARCCPRSPPTPASASSSYAASRAARWSSARTAANTSWPPAG